MKRLAIVLGLLGLVGIPRPADATLLMFEANLSGDQQVPPVVTQGTGFGTVLLDDVAHTIVVNLTFQNLSMPALLGHIHGPADASHNANVLFPFTGVPMATSGTLPEQTFSITDSQIADLEAGLDYFNLHTANNPNGEIRGQIHAVPEPGTLALAAGGLGTLGLLRRRRGER
ncbi:MAG TPA: CHRD domain-containing protein [Myxococcota bacterium]|jgi:hypothetical protein|nr:CHRD domain-containing protein [Myxococcota bacterium]